MSDGEVHIRVMRNGTLEDVISINENGQIGTMVSGNLGSTGIIQAPYLLSTGGGAFQNLPTSASGLASGTLYRDANNFVKIV